MAGLLSAHMRVVCVFVVYLDTVEVCSSSLHRPTIISPPYSVRLLRLDR
jgi:hypothetical protein